MTPEENQSSVSRGVPPAASYQFETAPAARAELPKPIDSRERFQHAAPSYNRHRPSYPAELLDWIITRTQVKPPDRLIDVGCGTGIAARLFAARGFQVTGVEPNEAMRGLAEQEGGAVAYVAGQATATGLPSGSADLVYAAQAFHYFPFDETLAEWRRLLVPAGAASTFWYRIAPGAIRDAYRKLRKRHGKREAATGGRATLKRLILDRLRGSPTCRDVENLEIEAHQDLDREGFAGRLHSSSRLAGLPVEAEKKLNRDINKVFERHAQGGVLRLPLRFLAIVWRFRD